MLDRRSAALHAACIAMIAMAVLIAFGDVAGPDRGLFFRDHLLVFKPRWWFAVESLRAHRLPVAPNPADASGIPYEMLLSSTYVPSTLLFFLADFDVAYDWYVISHFLILGTGIYGLASALGARRMEAVAAAGMALSGPFLSFENLLMGLGGIAWTPWVLWAFWAVLRRPTPARTALLALAAAFQLQGLWPEVLLLDVLGAVALFLYERPRTDLRRIAIALVSAAFLAAALAAIEIGPVLERLPETRRGRGFDYEEAVTWSVSFGQLIELVAPSFWAPPESPMIQPSRITGGLTPYFSTLYLGTGLFLASTALFAKPRRQAALALAAVALVFGLVAMGTPLHRFLWSLPLLDQSRFPVKYLPIASAALAALVPLALRTLERAPRILLFASAASCVVSISLLVLVGSAEFHAFLGRVLDVYPTAAASGLTALDCPRVAVEAMRPRLVHALVFAVLLLSAALAAAGSSRLRPFAHWAAALVVLFDLAFAARYSIAGAPIEPSGPPPPIRAKMTGLDHRYYAISPGGEVPAVPHRDGRTYFEEQISSSLARGDHLYRGARSFGDFDPDAESNHAWVHANDLVHRASPPRARAILGRAGVRFVTSPKRDPDLQNSMRFEVPEGPPQYLMEMSAVRPYVASYASARPIEIEGAPMRFLIALYGDSGESGPAIVLDPRYRGAVSTSSTTTQAKRCAPAEISGFLRGGAPSISPVDFDWAGSCPSIAVILEPGYPGWRVLVDGVERPILPVELGFMGVELEPGRRHVRFEYVPRARRWAWVSFGALALAAVLFSAGLWRRARPRTT